jgi:hypothetical protein
MYQTLNVAAADKIMASHLKELPIAITELILQKIEEKMTKPKNRQYTTEELANDKSLYAQFVRCQVSSIRYAAANPNGPPGEIQALTGEFDAQRVGFQSFSDNLEKLQTLLAPFLSTEGEVRI